MQAVNLLPTSDIEPRPLRRGRLNAVLLAALTLLVAGHATPPAAGAEPATVLRADQVAAVADTLADPTDLWVTATDLPRVNGFELKPEGACLEDLCIPLDQERDNELLVKRNGQSWVSVTGLARKLDQTYVADYDERVWSLGAVPATRSRFLDTAQAPDFTLPNRAGEPVKLSDFRGKKVLLLTWASW